MIVERTKLDGAEATISSRPSVKIETWTPDVPAQFRGAYQAFADRFGHRGIHCDLRWLSLLRSAFGYTTFVIAAVEDNDRVTGILPLAFVKSALFGRFLVGMPSVSWCGVVADDDATARLLIDRAVSLAEELNVRHLELRHEAELAHPALTQTMTSKVCMRLKLAASADLVWKGLKSVVRTQVRKGISQGFTVEWGRDELLADFYSIYSHNMRDLGTPVFGRSLFQSVLTEFSGQAEICVVRLQGKAVASAVSMYNQQLTEVPWVSTLAEYRATAANSWMYWQLIERAAARGDRIFDFGRSTIDSGTYNFKRKWGAEPSPLIWQYYVRKGCATDVRPENNKYQRAIAIWRRLPLRVTQWIGPSIVRGIPS